MNWGKQAISCAIAATLAFGTCPAFADGGALAAAPLRPQVRVAEQDLAAGVVLTDGTYAFESFTSSTGMVTPNAEDGPAIAVVAGDRVALVLDIYNPDKYDGLWAGKRSEAPADSYDASVLNATMVPAGDYAGNTNLWTDADGLIGGAGAVYKASRFVVTMSLDEFAESFGSGAGGDFYFAVRRALWSPSNPGKWMGSNDNYFTFSNLKRVGDSTDVPGGFPEDDAGEESALVRTRRLIDAIPYDPYKVVLTDADAIHAAETAYGQLSALEQQQLDAQEAANGVLTYGRSLQCASWGLDALSPVDDSTTLADGTYTTQVTSTCEMGKSNSVRGYKFTVAKVTVQGGHAKATLEHATSSPDTVSSGGVVYPHSNTDEKAHSTFEVPVDLNATFHFSQMAKNPTANTIAIPYEMTVAIDEQNAVPDPPTSESSGSDSESEAAATSEGKTSSSKTSSSKTSSSKTSSSKTSSSKTSSSKSSAARSSQRRSSSAAIAPSSLAASVAGRRGGASPGSGDAKAGDNAGVATAQPANSAVLTEPAGADDAKAAHPADEDAASPVDALAIAAAAVALAAVGFAAFTLDYRRRDKRRVSVSGVRLSDGRE